MGKLLRIGSLAICTLLLYSPGAKGVRVLSEEEARLAAREAFLDFTEEKGIDPEPFKVVDTSGSDTSRTKDGRSIVVYNYFWHNCEDLGHGQRSVFLVSVDDNGKSYVNGIGPLNEFWLCWEFMKNDPAWGSQWRVPTIE